MTIWSKEISAQLQDSGNLKQSINDAGLNTMLAALGIEFTAIGEDFLEATMPVDHRTKNPPGILHGGASAALAETIGSVASRLVAGKDQICVGIEINASHLNSVREGFVVGRVTPIRLGHGLHVWDIDIRDGSAKEYRPICRSRLTVLIRERKRTV